MFSLVLGALAVGYLPGAVIYRLPGRSHGYRASLPFEERLFWAVIISLFWSLALVLASAAIGQYSFERLVLANVLGPAAAAAVCRRRLVYAPGAPRPTWRTAIPVGLVALGVWLYFPPSEYIIGGKDPGTYLNEGIQIAQRGSVIIRDTVVADVPAPFRDLFFPFHDQDWYYSVRFMGFFIQDPAPGDVIGQFPHLFPASIAVGYGLNGLSGARQTVGVWAILGTLAIYFAACGLIGRRAAAAAAVLTAINVVSVWFGRYPNSEVVMQAGLFAALLAFARTWERRDVFFSVLAGSLLGAMLFLRYDIVLAFLSLGLAATLAPAGGTRVRAAFGVALLATSAVGYWYLQGPMRAYSYYPLGFTRDHGALILAALAIAGASAHIGLRFERVRTAIRQAVPYALAFTLLALAVYAYFLREPVGKLALGDAIAFRSFGWYIGAWVLGLATVGFVVLAARRFWLAPAFFLTVAAFSVFFFYKTRIVPEHFWAGRRFLGAILPAAMIGVAALVDTVAVSALAWVARTARSLPHILTGAGAATVLSIALLAPVGWSFWGVSAPVWRHVEYAGLIPQLEALASRFTARDLVIVESRDAGSDLHLLAEPLAYIYAKNVLVLNSAAPEKLPLEQFIAWAHSHYAAVYFLGGGGTDLLTSHLTATSVAADRFQVPEYDARLNAFPSGIRRKDFEFGLYRLSLSSEAQSGAVRVDIGGQDDLNVVRFHARETSGDGVAFRWTQAQSFILLPGLSPQATTVTIWMGRGGRPAAAPPPLVDVMFNDTAIGTATPVDELRPYTFPLPAARPTDGNAPMRVRLRVSTWNPQSLLGVNDNRELGVQVTRVDAQ